MSFPYPFTIVVSDGKSMRALKPAQLGRHAPLVEAALCDLLLEASGVPLAPTAPAATQAIEPAATATMTQGELARAQGYTGDCCSQCGQFRMKQSGHCLVCDACGTTTGCS